MTFFHINHEWHFVLQSYQKWDTDPMIPFPPVVEPDIPGAYITKHPRDGHDENALQIPFLTGLTFDEGAMKSARKCYS